MAKNKVYAYFVGGQEGIVIQKEPVEQVTRCENSGNKQFDYQTYLLSEAWKSRRQVALKAAGYRCRVCNSKSQLDVHHRTYKRIGHEDQEDLTVLCRRCHFAFHDLIKNQAAKSKAVPKTVEELVDEHYKRVEKRASNRKKILDQKKASNQKKIRNQKKTRNQKKKCHRQNRREKIERDAHKQADKASVMIYVKRPERWPDKPAEK